MVNTPLVSVVIVTRNRKEKVSNALKSIFDQTYKSMEVIVVDNASSADTSEYLTKKFPKISLIKSLINSGGAGGRNLGAKKAKGDFMFFMDDDAIADKRAIENLVSVLREQGVGVVQPKIYHLDRPDVIQGVGHGINLLTGRVYGIGVNENDHGQYEKVMSVPMVGCCWMVKNEVFKKIGFYDEDYFIPYEDSDFSHRVHKAGFQVLFVPQAKVWHDSHRVEDLPPQILYLGITTPERAYRISRNKMIFMRKHAPKINFLVYLFIFTPVYVFIHSLIMIYTRRFDILTQYWRGLFSGFWYVVSSK